MHSKLKINNTQLKYLLSDILLANVETTLNRDNAIDIDILDIVVDTALSKPAPDMYEAILNPSELIGKTNKILNNMLTKEDHLQWHIENNNIVSGWVLESTKRGVFDKQCTSREIAKATEDAKARYVEAQKTSVAYSLYEAR